MADNVTIIEKVHLSKGKSDCVRLATELGGARSFRYFYDFGADWEHRIKVERRLPHGLLFDRALCIVANATPPAHTDRSFHGWAYCT